MVVNERDKVCAKTLLELLSKAKYDLSGTDVITAYKVMHWATELLSRIDNELKPQPVAAPMASIEEAKQPVRKSSKKAK